MPSPSAVHRILIGRTAPCWLRGAPCRWALQSHSEAPFSQSLENGRWGLEIWSLEVVSEFRQATWFHNQLLHVLHDPRQYDSSELVDKVYAILDRVESKLGKKIQS